MTNKEAIEIIKAYKDRLTSSCSNQLDNDIEAFTLAIKALKMAVNQEVQMQMINGMIYAPTLYRGCFCCDAYEKCPDAFCSNAVHCNAYGVKKNENS